VLKIFGESMSPDILDNMLNKFGISLVEETQFSVKGITRLLIQFPDLEKIKIFNQERDLWARDSNATTILTYAQRRDLFNCIESIKNVTREDRIGPRLNKMFCEKKPLPQDFFIVDFDVWFNGETKEIIEKRKKIEKVLGTGGSKILGDFFEIQSLLLGRASVNEFSLNALLDFDLIASVDLPLCNIMEEPFNLYSNDFKPIVSNLLDENAPLATVIDSGIFTGNPLLQNLVVAEEDFDKTENTTSDLNGHGTGVAGIVAYGDLDRCIKTKQFIPLVRICNAKIMHNDKIFDTNNTSFSKEKRPEQIISEAVLFFYKNYQCRIFNLSIGNFDLIYQGGRQFPLAEMLDQLVRTLNIVIVISAGNVDNPEICESFSRDEIMKNSRDQLFSVEHRLIDPATASLCITVGAITRNESPDLLENRPSRIPAGKRDYPSVFSRIGKGVNKAIKPELVDYGGNYVAYQLQTGKSKWYKNDLKLVEPTLNNTNESFFKGYCGTSFSAPHVTHYAARIERAIQNQINEQPSANLIRAMLANTAICTPEMLEWAEQSTDRLYTGKDNPKQDRRLRLIGYGKASDNILYSDKNHVTLFSEDSLNLRTFHLYKIPVIDEFMKNKSSKRIAISLAYDPITRLNRKDYLTCNLWFEVFRKINQDSLIQYMKKKESNQDEDDDLGKIPDSQRASFSPGYTELMRSTLQQRVWFKGPRGGTDLLVEDGSFLYILVTGKERFKNPDQNLPQNYALVITFSYESEEDIQLYNKIKDKVSIKARIAVKERVQIKF
jgi:hypothetical protein